MDKVFATQLSDSHLRERAYGFVHRGKDFFSAVMSAIELTASMKLSYIFHTGDMLNSSRPSTTGAIDELDQIDALLKKRKITMFLIDGNHDKAEPSWFSRFKPDGKGYGIHYLCNETVKITIPESDTPILVRGIPFCSREELLAKLRGLKEYTDIILWHGMVQEFAGGFGAQDVVTMEELESCPNAGNFLLGDIHVHKYFSLRSRPGIIGYSGSTEYCDQGEDIVKRAGVVHYQGKKLDGHALLGISSVDLTTRLVLHRSIMTDAAMDAFLQELQTTKAQHPILIGNYNPAIPNFFARIYTASSPQSVMLMAPRDVNAPLNTAGLIKSAAALKPSALLPSLLAGQGNSDLLGVMCAVADDPEAAPDKMLADYLSSKYQL